MKKCKVHIRAKKPVIGHPDAKTLCGERLHHKDIERVGTRISGLASQTHENVLYSVTLSDADQMDGSETRRNGRSRRLLPPMRGPKLHKQDRWGKMHWMQQELRIPECDWCEACFDSPMRTLKQLGKMDL